MYVEGDQRSPDEKNVFRSTKKNNLRRDNKLKNKDEIERSGKTFGEMQISNRKIS
ncbi:hypothetical protein CEXT_230131, partial [Caerostris extrusa]